MSETVLLCDCLKSQPLDAEGIARASGRTCSRVHSFLCGDEAGIVAAAMSDGPVVVACAQERARFEEIAADVGAEPPVCVDLRDRAGWSDDPATKSPKQAALLAEALLPVRPTRVIDIESRGTCLLIGPSDAVLPEAARLSRTLAVTCLLSDAADPPDTRDFDVIHGTVRRAQGALGRFEVVIDGFRQVIPGGRGGLSMSRPRDGAHSACDVIVDLSGGTPLFPAHHKREGYLRADPGARAAVSDAVLNATQLIGTFEQPLHVALEPSICAHARAQQTGCTRCLDACPTGAISPAGDHVAVDPYVCAGCGACSALCPSGAISFDAPSIDDVFRRLTTLAETFRAAGGHAPRLLVHDEDHGAELIALCARHGAGLPADRVPFAMPSLAAFGHAEALAALGVGFAEVAILLSPRTERDVIEGQCDLAQALSGGRSVRVIDVADPLELTEALMGPAPEPCAPILPMGRRRQVARLAAKALGGEGVVALPDGAPYGAVLVDTDACTLCLSCVPLCPSGALSDNPDRPQLLFQEDACLQCGLCANICPEDAITLAPRMDLSDAALAPRILNDEEPFDCVECGTPFGVRSTIERITAQLAGKHHMFQSAEALRVIQMCDDCRVRAQARTGMLAGPARPVAVTSADYGQPEDAVVLPPRRKNRRKPRFD